MRLYDFGIGIVIIIAIFGYIFLGLTTRKFDPYYSTHYWSGDQKQLLKKHYEWHKTQNTKCYCDLVQYDPVFNRPIKLNFQEGEHRGYIRADYTNYNEIEVKGGRNRIGATYVVQYSTIPVKKPKLEIEWFGSTFGNKKSLLNTE